MKRYLAQQRLMKIALVYFLTLAFLNCSPDKLKETTDDTVNITQYLKDHEDYSLFLEALEITNYASFMNTYGTYTLFLPTNEAMKQYLTDVGAASLKEVPLKDLQDLVKLHILDQVVVSTSFTDGKIATPSMYGQYLVTGAANINGTSRNTVNKTTNIIALNLVVGNGVIHVIDKVLRVANKTLAQTIEADPSLSIFTEALKATGWYDKLNQPLTIDENKVASFLTVLTQTNEEFKAANINSLSDLKTKYSHLKDPMNPKDSLNLFVSYRVLTKLQYLADLAVTLTLETKAPLEVISVKLDKEVLLLNEEVFNGILEKGVSVNRTKSDVTTSNGVLHFVNSNFFIKKRLPAPVYFDLADQPEFRSITSIFRKHAGGSILLTHDQISGITWEGTESVKYLDGKAGTSTGGGWHGDLLELNRFKTGLTQNLILKTPVIIKGKYKVWVDYRPQSSKMPTLKVYFNGIELPKLVNCNEYTSTSSTDNATERVLESQGYRHPVHPYDGNLNSKLVGVIDVPTTGRHTIKFESITASPGNVTWLDVVEFRPIDMDQIWPKLEKGGDRFVNSNLTYY